MANSNLDKPRIQPFKCITLKMKHPTDLSIPYTDINKADHAKIRKTGNNIYTPVYMDSNNDKGELVACTTVDNGYSKGDPIVGVLIESFRYPGVESRVMVQGIVPMQVNSPINPGDLVAPITDNDSKHRIGKAAASDYAFGIALTKGTTKDDWIAVLLCRGMKVKA